LILGLIPARGGSKGIPHKNLATVGGKPLIAWTIDAALACASLDRIVVSSDDSGIIETAVAYGAEAPFVRPAELSSDTAAMLSVVCHAVSALRSGGFQVDTVVVLQPTSPLRTAADIRACLALHNERGCPVVSVTRTKANPAWMFSMGDDGRLLRRAPLETQVPVRRQDLPELVVPNGAIYVISAGDLDADRSFFDNAAGYLMPPERSLDIDEPFDLDLVRLLVEARRMGEVSRD